MTKDYSVLKAVESQIRRIKIFYPRKRLHRSDVDLFRDTLLLEYHLIGDLLPLNENALRRFRGFLGTSEIDILKYAQTFKFADAYLKNTFGSNASDAEWSLQSFKHSVKDANLYWGLLKPFEEEIDCFFKAASPDIFRTLNTWINFPGRVNLVSLDLSSESIVDYCQQELKMGSWTYDGSLLSEMHDVMSEWLKDFTWDHFVPQHGPGSVADFNGRLPVLYKHQLHEMDLRLRYFYLRDVKIPLSECFPSISSCYLSRTSQLTFVAKSMMKNRTISAEPLSLQYSQQGAKRALYRYFKDNACLSLHIDLENQQLSQDAARKGSLCGGLDTLDLSNASDSVSLFLIKKVFAGTPLFRALICTRSDSTRLPNGVVMRLNKFAPMGSSLCFPVETLVFACICEVASRKHRSKPYYRVYGDDIVCSKELTEDIMNILDSLNFELNRTKSFYTAGIHNFREACGGEYLDGVDVTPLRLSRQFKSYCDENECTITSANTVESFISLANAAFDRGFYNVRRCVLHLLEVRYPYYKGLLFGRDAAHLNTFEDGLTNWKLKKRFLSSTSGRKPCFQRTEYYCVSPCSKVDRQALIDLRVDPRMDPFEEDSIRLFEYFRSRLDCDYYEGINVNGLIVKPSAFKSGHLRLCEEADIFAFPPDPIDVRPTRAVMHWKWVSSPN